ncbi:hypothetical protein ACH5RR_024971 [Cinchona calisaya]|uniref:Uncharacterized protein n=1 Tax=Cinchona calisaya TaxID=153742 RepID=A0ABD2YZC8_9GENT
MQIFSSLVIIFSYKIQFFNSLMQIFSKKNGDFQQQNPNFQQQNGDFRQQNANFQHYQVEQQPPHGKRKVAQHNTTSKKRLTEADKGRINANYAWLGKEPPYSWELERMGQKKKN